MKHLPRIENRIKEKLLIVTYTDIILDYIMRRFNIPRSEISVLYEVSIRGRIRLDLVLVYNGTWFIVEFKIKPRLKQDLERIVRYVKAVNDSIKPEKTIPILAYIYQAPSTNIVDIVKDVKPLIVLHLIQGTYRVLYESI